MEQIKDIVKVSISYEELMNCSIVESNRCGYTSKKVALENGVSEADWNDFVSRAKKIKKMIVKNGFSNASSFVLAKDENNNLYLLDGQGRRFALKLMHDESNIDFSNNRFIADLYVNPMTKEEMANAIITLNIGSTNWKTKDLRRASVIESGDEEVKKAFDEYTQLRDNYNLNDYVACLLTFGERASHMRSNGDFGFTPKDYATTKEVFTKAYLKFINTISNNEVDKYGNEIERPSKIQKAIRNTNVAISLNSCMRSIVKAHKYNIETAKGDIDMLINALIKQFSGSNDYIEQLLKGSKKDKAFIADIVRRSCVQRPMMRKALYATAER